MHRVGVLPIKRKNSDLVMLFVSSQTRGRWVLPKGRLKKNETHDEGCHREAYEEAGIRGTVLSDFPVTAAISRETPKGLEKIPVTYYPMLVDDISDKWPEANDRKRRWVRMKEAKNVIAGRDMLDIVKRFDKLMPWIHETIDELSAEQRVKLKLVK